MAVGPTASTGAQAAPDGMPPKHSGDEAVFDAAMRLAAEQGWNRLTLASIADAANLPLVDLYKRFTTKQAILDGMRKAVDHAMLAGGAVPEGPARDRLFEVLMRRSTHSRPGARVSPPWLKHRVAIRWRRSAAASVRSPRWRRRWRRPGSIPRASAGSYAPRRCWRCSCRPCGSGLRTRARTVRPQWRHSTRGSAGSMLPPASAAGSLLHLRRLRKPPKSLIYCGLVSE
jgi:AcrR family transcriptional regulator